MEARKYGQQGAYYDHQIRPPMRSYQMARPLIQGFCQERARKERIKFEGLIRRRPEKEGEGTLRKSREHHPLHPPPRLLARSL
jgi:hypothetical protein